MKRRFLCLPLALALLLCACGEEVGTGASPSPGGVPAESQPAAPLPDVETLPETEAPPEAEVLPETDPEPEEGSVLEQRAREILAGLTVEEKVGQLFLARCPDTDAAELAEEYRLGGYLLFRRDFQAKTPEQVRETIASYQAWGLPMLIAVDEEGGTVVRVSSQPAFRSSPFRSPRAVYADGGLEAVLTDTEEKTALLSSLGINLNLAPVCDVSTAPADFMYDRSLGQDAETTAGYIAAVVECMNGTGVGSALKHFPGYGSSLDSHTGIAVDERPLSAFQECDLLPFQAGIDAGASCVLVAHTIVSCMDPDYPASLSPAVHELLREMGFRGVILTDDLAMDGIRKFTGDREAAVQAVLAGNDLLCCTDFQTQLPAVLAAVEDGTISQKRLDQSVLRVLVLKLELGLFADQ